MARNDKKLRIPSRYVRYFSAALLALAFLALYLIAVLQLTPKRYELIEGSVAPETIYAPRDVVDEAATEALRALARRNAQPVYRIDTDKVNALTASADGFFGTVQALRVEAKNLVLSAGGDVSALASAKDWESTLSKEQASAFMERTNPQLTEKELYDLLAASPEELTYLQDIVTPKLTVALGGGLKADALERVKSESVLELKAVSRLNDALKAVGEKLLASFMQPTYVLDEKATAQAQQNAADNVAEITIKKGETLAAEGSVITLEQLDLLERLELVRAENADTNLKTGVGVYILVLYAIFMAYLFVMCHEVLTSLKSTLILFAFLTLTALATWAVSSINAHFSLMLFAVMLAALLVSPRAGFAVTLVAALFSGLIACGRGTPLFGAEYVTLLLSALGAGVVTVLSLRKTHNRGAIIAAGSMGGVAAAAVKAALYVALSKNYTELLADMGWALGSAMLSAMLVVGSLSIWENLFDVATAPRLSELLNTNQPLLKQLMQDAPGTYQHSMAVAALAEAAAERIGADALLARVGGAYHDVGKLKRPLYFKENQLQGENVHDTLPPAESAAAIIAHQKDGVALLMRHKLPSAVIRIAADHHGNAMMSYFYQKALNAGGTPPNAKQFRYAGNKPSTKESAIVMLADTCEAAVRSMGESTREAREEMVHRLIFARLNDPENLLLNAPLTLADLTAIEASFIKTLAGILHERVEYPPEAKK